MRGSLVWAVFATLMIGTALGAWAQYSGEPINSEGVQCFAYEGYAYVPLRNTADFIGASVSWDTYHNQATVVYNDNSLLLTIGSTNCYYLGRPARLAVPPISVGGQLMVPATMFDDFFFVDVAWQPDQNQVFILGPSGWGYYYVDPTPPPGVAAMVASYAPVYVPPPFYYDDECYVPLLDYCDFFAFPIFFEPDFDDFVIIIHDHECLLRVGDRDCFFGDERFELRHAPIIVNNTVCVPVGFFQDRRINAPVRLVGDSVRLRGPTGWRQSRIDPRPPAAVNTVLPSRPERLGIPMRPRTMPNVAARAPRQAFRPTAPAHGGAVAGRPGVSPEIGGRQTTPQQRVAPEVRGQRGMPQQRAAPEARGQRGMPQRQMQAPQQGPIRRAEPPRGEIPREQVPQLPREQIRQLPREQMPREQAPPPRAAPAPRSYGGGERYQGPSGGAGGGRVYGGGGGMGGGRAYGGGGGFGGGGGHARRDPPPPKVAHRGKPAAQPKAEAKATRHARHARSKPSARRAGEHKATAKGKKMSGASAGQYGGK